jgi:hypothetical protein
MVTAGTASSSGISRFLFRCAVIGTVLACLGFVAGILPAIQAMRLHAAARMALFFH